MEKSNKKKRPVWKTMLIVTGIAAIGISSVKAYQKFKDFSKNFDFKIGIKKLQKFDLKTGRASLLLNLTISNFTGMSFNLSNLTNLIKAGGIKVGQTNPIEKISVPSGTTKSFDIPLVLDLGSAAYNFKAVLNDITINTRVSILGVPYTNTEKVNLTSYLPTIQNSISQFFPTQEYVEYEEIG